MSLSDREARIRRLERRATAIARTLGSIEDALAYPRWALENALRVLDGSTPVAAPPGGGVGDDCNGNPLPAALYWSGSVESSRVFNPQTVFGTDNYNDLEMLPVVLGGTGPNDRFEAYNGVTLTNRSLIYYIGTHTIRCYTGPVTFSDESVTFIYAPGSAGVDSSYLNDPPPCLAVWGIGATAFSVTHGWSRPTSGGRTNVPSAWKQVSPGPHDWSGSLTANDEFRLDLTLSDDTKHIFTGSFSA